MRGSATRRRWEGIGWRAAPLVLALNALVAGGCIRSLAVNALADSLAASGDVFASDEDPELVREAMPFALKTIESLLAEKPDHRGLLLAACRGFTGYAYAFVAPEAEALEYLDYRRSAAIEERALKLYLRARDYCLRSLELASPGVRRALETEPQAALADFDREDVPLLFWTAASWGAAISAGVDRPELTVDFPAVRALVEHALALEESWDAGSLHEVMMVVEALPETMGGSAARARRHFERAVELSGGARASPFVGLAASVAVAEQNRAEFEELLERSLAVDVDADPGSRLANLVAQRRAERLLESADDLFLSGGESDEN